MKSETICKILELFENCPHKILIDYAQSALSGVDIAKVIRAMESKLMNQEIGVSTTTH
jgi:hypothetical protein